MSQPLDTRNTLIMTLVVIAVALFYILLRDPAPAPHAATDTASVPRLAYRIVATYPHDPNAYTQGLLYSDGLLFEGTGVRGQSSLRRVDLETGQVLAIHRLPAHLFGEGIAEIDDRLIQLTWQARTGFVYAKATLTPLRTFRYQSEGWGLTFDGTHLILSDGSARLRFLDPDTFAVVNTIEAHTAKGPVANLNELEYIEGAIFANVWKSDRIVRISPDTGAVTGEIDLAPMIETMRLTGSRSEANGIAYDPVSRRLFVTGKLWPRLFEIALEE